MIKFYLWLYNLVKPVYDKLYAKVYPTLKAQIEAAREALRKQLQAAEYAKAEKLQKALWERVGTPGERLKKLIPRVSEDRCQHVKGGMFGIQSPRRDYNVRYFSFPDGRSDIKCLTCGKTWTPKSPDWKDALKMADQSTNTPGASERTMFVGEVTGKVYNIEDIKPSQYKQRSNKRTWELDEKAILNAQAVALDDLLYKPNERE